MELGPNRYGKSAIRLVKVVREGDQHAVRDLTVAIALEGEFAAAHTDADNRDVVATDTMKNTVYAMAPEHLTGSPEAFGLTLARHFCGYGQVEQASVTLREHPWQRIEATGAPSATAFARRGDLTRTAAATVSKAGESVESGVEDLVVMKMARCAFSGFPRDEYTTLPETTDRIVATKLAATWRYTRPVDDYDAAWQRVLDTMLAVFADHESASVQASIWQMGSAVLDRVPEVGEIRMSLPNLHHWLVDLSPFGLANENEIFVATSEPYGLIEATVRRGESGESPKA